MKLCSLAIVGLSTTVVALSLARPDQTLLGNDDQELYLVEMSPGHTRVRHFSAFLFLFETAFLSTNGNADSEMCKWITEDEKWALRRVCSNNPPLENRPLPIEY